MQTTIQDNIIVPYLMMKFISQVPMNKQGRHHPSMNPGLEIRDSSSFTFSSLKPRVASIL